MAPVHGGPGALQAPSWTTGEPRALSLSSFLPHCGLPSPFERHGGRSAWVRLRAPNRLKGKPFSFPDPSSPGKPTGLAEDLHANTLLVPFRVLRYPLHGARGDAAGGHHIRS